MYERTFRAFGVDCRVVVGDEPTLADLGRRRVLGLEATWSRERSDAELVLLSRIGDRRPLIPSADVLDLIRTVRDAELLVADRSAIEIDEGQGTVAVPFGTLIDPIGVVDGCAADRAAQSLVDAGATWVMVSIGNTTRFGGSELAERGWKATVAAPNAAGDVCRLRIHGGAVATARRPRSHQRRNRSAADPTVDFAAVVGEEAWRSGLAARLCVRSDLTQAKEWLRVMQTSAHLVDAEATTHSLGLGQVLRG